MAVKLCRSKIFVLISLLFFSTSYSQKDIRVVAFDDAAIEKYGKVKVLSHLASVIHNVKSGDIVFDMNLWEPVDFAIALRDPNKKDMVLDYQEAQRIFFNNVKTFCNQSLAGERFFITAPRSVHFYEQAHSMYLESLKNLGLKEELPNCVEFAYAKGYEKEIVVEGDAIKKVAIVKLENTDLQHMSFAINRSVWGANGIRSMRKGVEREIFLEYSMVDTSNYFDESYIPVNHALALSTITNDEIIDSDLTIFSAHSTKRDAFVRRVDASGKIKQ